MASSSSKRPRGSSSSSGQSRGRGIFEHPEVKVFFDSQCKGKRIVPDTSLDETAKLHYQPLMTPVIVNNWNYFTKDTDSAFSKGLVWEFYAHAHYREQLSPGCRKSWVRGKEISYDAQTIATVLGLPFYPDTTDWVRYYLARTLDDGDVDDLKHTLFLGDKDWTYGRNGSIKFVLAKYLGPVARFWLQFVCHNLYPQSHLTECKLPALRIVYGIRKQMSVDAAWLMSESLFHAARESKPGSFGLPWVIHKLCHEAGVFFGDDLRDLTRTPRLNRKTYENYVVLSQRQCDNPAQPPAPAPVPDPTPASGVPPLAPTPSGAALDDLTRQMQQMMRRQRRQYNILRMENQMHQARDAELRAHGYLIPQYTPEQLQLFYHTSSSDDMQDEGEDSP